ncbi:MAG: hypothetical protein WAT09_19620 [Paracoccaceae bacterium]
MPLPGSLYFCADPGELLGDPQLGAGRVTVTVSFQRLDDFGRRGIEWLSPSAMTESGIVQGDDGLFVNPDDPTRFFPGSGVVFLTILPNRAAQDGAGQIVSHTFYATQLAGTAVVINAHYDAALRPRWREIQAALTALVDGFLMPGPMAEAAMRPR